MLGGVGIGRAEARRHRQRRGSRCRASALGAVLGDGGEWMPAAGAAPRNRRRTLFAELCACLVLVLTPETLHRHVSLGSGGPAGHPTLTHRPRRVNRTLG